MGKILKCIMLFVLVAGSLSAFTGGAAAGELIKLSTAAFFNGEEDVPSGLAVDGLGNIIMAGYSYIGGKADFLTVKYDGSLNMISSATFNGLAGGWDYANSVAVDGSNNIIVAGSAGGANEDFLTIKYDQNLTIISSATFNGAANRYDRITAVAVDTANNIIVTGISNNGVDNDILTIKYDPDFVLLASATYDSGGHDNPSGVVVDHAGNIFVAAARNSADWLILKYGPDLNLLGSQTFDSGGSDVMTAIALDGSGNIVVAGHSDERGNDDFRVHKYDANLTLLSSATYDCQLDSNDQAGGVAVDSRGNILLTGSSYKVSWDFFTIRCNPDLTVISSAVYAGASCAYAVTVDQFDNIIVAGDSDDSDDKCELIKYNGASPSITSGSPSTGLPGSTISMTINGANFFPGAVVAVSGTGITLNTTNIINKGLIELNFTIASNAPAGKRDVSITNTDGTVLVVPQAFEVASTVVNSTSSFISAATGGTVFLSPVYGDLSVDIPAGAFSEDVTVTVTTTVVPASSQANIKVTGIGISITNNKNLQPAQDIQITLRYRNSDITGFDEDKLAIARYDAGQWVAMSTAVDKDYNAAVCAARNLSIFALVENNTDGSSSTNINNTSGGGVTLTPESGPVIVSILAGTFGQDVILAVSSTPVPVSNQSTVKTTGIGIEITNSAGLQPNKEITITVSYRDSDIIGMDESKLTLARYDAVNARWVPIKTLVLADTNTLIGTIKHLSTFAVVQLAPAADLAAIKAYPNPFNPKNGALAITNLTQQADIKIYTVAGELVRTLPYTSADGRVLWDGKNDGGTVVASDVYLAYIKSPQGKKTVKIAVER